MKWLVLILLGSLVAGAAQSQKLYRWTDAQGRTHVTDRPPPTGTKDVETATARSAAQPQIGANEPYALRNARQNHPVTLYTAPDCAQGCAEAREYLNKRGVPFREISVTDSARFEELKKVSGGAGVPVMLVGKAIFKGYEVGTYERALDAGGYPRMGMLPPRSQPAPDAPVAGGPPPAVVEPPPPASGPYAPRFKPDPPKGVGPYAPRFDEKPAAQAR